MMEVIFGLRYGYFHRFHDPKGDADRNFRAEVSMLSYFFLVQRGMLTVIFELRLA